MKKTFIKADKNGDGQLSREEIIQGKDQLTVNYIDSSQAFRILEEAKSTQFKALIEFLIILTSITTDSLTTHNLSQLIYCNFKLATKIN